jgi:hypothetical protein
MDAETFQDQVSAGAAEVPPEAARHAEPAQPACAPSHAGLEDALLRRLDRIVALAARRGEPAPHGELLDELRGLLRAAEQLGSPTPETAEEVVERPARRLHGT